MGTAPTVELFLWDVEQGSPIGSRHVASGTDSYIKTLDTSASGALDFGRVIVSPASGGLSKTFAITFRKRQVGNDGDINSIENMKFWMPNHEAVETSLDKISFLYDRSGVWLQNKVLHYQNADTIPSSLPDTQNLFRQDGSGVITSGSLSQTTFLDLDVTEFVYIATQPSSDFPLGAFGFDSSSGLLFRVTYDYIGDLSLYG
jgi:hypothetical protein